ncbi:MAG: site-specific DNA-methyltransferase [Parvibaculum sp.]
MHLNFSEDEVKRLHKIAEHFGLTSPDDLIRRWLGECEEQVERDTVSSDFEYKRPKTFWKGSAGKIYHGDSRGLLHKTLEEHSVDLVVTSPPFALRHKKAYGNEDAHLYLRWFRPFAAGLKRVLKPHGSLVIDIGPAWQEGIPAKSLYQFELLTMLCEEYGFYLAQDFYWWNPSRMPVPAEWVNIRRLRVKDSINPVWWLSPTPWPKASNRRVLTPYSKSQRSLMKSGYNAGPRPSGHVVSDVWNRDNGGAIPSNLIAAPNTASDDPYLKYCRMHGLEPHPARFPWTLPEFFIRMLTDKGDVVLDPFAGSCITGEVSEMLGRNWICGEIHEHYLEGALSRFKKTTRRHAAPTQPPEGYRARAPHPYCPAAEEPLDPEGGRVLD